MCDGYKKYKEIEQVIYLFYNKYIIKRNRTRKDVESLESSRTMDNEQLVIRIKAGIDVADNMLMLWQQNQGFIGKMALKYSGYAELEDLKQEAYFGLCEAVNHYDAGKGASFITYSGFWIKQAMQRYVENNSGVVRIPVHAMEWIMKYKKIQREYRKYYGSEPSDWELCGFLGIDADKLHMIKQSLKMGRIRSLSEVIGGEEEDVTLSDIVAADEDIEAEVMERLDTAAMKKELWGAVDQLPDKQPEIIRKRYQHGMTLKQISEEMSVAPERVRQIESKAMRSLRMPHRSWGFRVYYEQYLSAHSFWHVSVGSFQRTWTSEVEREALREYDQEEEHKWIMSEAEQTILENMRWRKRIGDA